VCYLNKIPLHNINQNLHKSTKQQTTIKGVYRHRTHENISVLTDYAQNYPIQEHLYKAKSVKGQALISHVNDQTHGFNTPRHV